MPVHVRVASVLALRARAKNSGGTGAAREPAALTMSTTTSAPVDRPRWTPKAAPDS
jgi:hypothetical protein